MSSDATLKEAHGTISVAAIVAESAIRHPDAIAVILGEEQVTYRDLWDQVRSYAGALRDMGIVAGDRVAVLMPNIVDFPRVYYAVLSLGAVVVPINALLKSAEIAYMLQDSGVKAIVVAAPLLKEGALAAEKSAVPVYSVLEPVESSTCTRLEDLATKAEPIVDYTPCAPEDTATILYTSGTTGRPKGAEGTHFALVEQVNTLLTSTFDIKRGDRLLGALPLFHTFGQTVVLNTGIRAGATIVLLPKFEYSSAYQLLIDAQIDIFVGVPTMYIAFLKAARENLARPSLRYGISGGASLPVAIIDDFREIIGAPIYEGYGLTETSPVATFNHVGETPKPGTIGKPIWGVKVEIAAPEIETNIKFLPRGERGELVIQGHNVMKGYLNQPEATESAIVDGWFRTGDLGVKDEDGYISIVDRKKDMILRNGYNVYPREVEELLIRHPGIASVAVYGVPHDIHGQEVAAAIVVQEGANLTPEEVIEYASERIAAYKYPRIVEFVAALPQNATGKVLKRDLVARHTISKGQ